MNHPVRLEGFNRQIVLGKSVHWANCPMGKMYLREIVPWANCPLDKVSLGKSVPWENCPFGKLPLGKIYLGKFSLGNIDL